MQVNDRFKSLRAEFNKVKGKDLTLNEFGELIGIKGPKISELENGRRDASLNELKAYHKFFNAPYEYLLGENNIRHCTNISINGNESFKYDAIIEMSMSLEKAQRFVELMKEAKVLAEELSLVEFKVSIKEDRGGNN